MSKVKFLILNLFLLIAATMLTLTSFSSKALAQFVIPCQEAAGLPSYSLIIPTKEGSVSGRPIEFAVYSNGGIPESATEGYQKLVVKDEKGSQIGSVLMLHEVLPDRRILNPTGDSIFITDPVTIEKPGSYSITILYAIARLGTCSNQYKSDLGKVDFL